MMKTKFYSKLFLILTIFSCQGPALANWEDKSPLETVDMVRCTAAVMRSGMGIDAYKKWTAALEKRYKKIHSLKTIKEVDVYMSERILEKRAELQRQGLQTAPAFKRYYQLNCADFHP